MTQKGGILRYKDTRIKQEKIKLTGFDFCTFFLFLSWFSLMSLYTKCPYFLCYCLTLMNVRSWMRFNIFLSGAHADTKADRFNQLGIGGFWLKGKWHLYIYISMSKSSRVGGKFAPILWLRLRTVELFCRNQKWVGPRCSIWFVFCPYLPYQVWTLNNSLPRHKFTVWENEKFIWIFCQHLLKLSEP